MWAIWGEICTHSYVLCLMSIAYKTNTFHNNKFLLIKIPFICSTGNCFTYLKLIFLRNVALTTFRLSTGIVVGEASANHFFFLDSRILLFSRQLYFYFWPKFSFKIVKHGRFSSASFPHTSNVLNYKYTVPGTQTVVRHPTVPKRLPWLLGLANLFILKSNDLCSFLRTVSFSCEK